MQTCRLPQPCWSTANTNNAQYLLPCEMCRASHHHGSATTSWAHILILHFDCSSSSHQSIQPPWNQPTCSRTRSTIDLNCRRERRDTPPLQHEQIENRRRKNKCANACTARTNVRKRESTIGMCDGDVVVVLNRAIEVRFGTKRNSVTIHDLET